MAVGPDPLSALKYLTQIDTDLQQLTKAIGQLRNQAVAVDLVGIMLTPVVPPAAPASGSIIYVDSGDGHTYVVNSSGVRTQIAP